MAIELTTASEATLSGIRTSLGLMEEVLGFAKIADLTTPQLSENIGFITTTYNSSTPIFTISNTSIYALGTIQQTILQTVGDIPATYYDFSKFYNLKSFRFNSGPNIQTINLSNSKYIQTLDCSSNTSLTSVQLPETGLNYIATSTGTGNSISFQNCTSLSAQELLNVFNKLPDMGGRSARVLWSGTAAASSPLSSTLVEALTSRGYTSVS